MENQTLRTKTGKAGSGADGLCMHDVRGVWLSVHQRNSTISQCAIPWCAENQILGVGTCSARHKGQKLVFDICELNSDFNQVLDKFGFSEGIITNACNSNRGSTGSQKLGDGKNH